MNLDNSENKIEVAQPKKKVDPILLGAFLVFFLGALILIVNGLANISSGYNLAAIGEKIMGLGLLGVLASIIIKIIRTFRWIWESPKLARSETKSLSILYALLLLPSIMMIGFSFMGFDAPGSENDMRLWLFVLSIDVFPLSLLIGFIAGLMKEPRKTLVLLPFYNLTLVIIAGLLLWL